MDTKIVKHSGRKWTLAGLTLSVLSLLLQIIGYSCPGWIVIIIYLDVIGDVFGSEITGFGEITTAVSIWYGRVCIDGDYQDTPTCDIKTGNDPRFYGFRITTALNPLSEIGWVRVKIWLTAGLYVACTGTFLSALSMTKGRKVPPKMILPWASICMLVSGALAVPAVVEIVLATLTAEKAIDSQTDVTGHRLVKFGYPWAMIVTSSSVLVAAVSAVCLCVAACKSRVVKARGYDADFYDIGSVENSNHTRL